MFQDHRNDPVQAHFYQWREGGPEKSSAWAKGRELKAEAGRPGLLTPRLVFFQAWLVLRVASGCPA